MTTHDLYDPAEIKRLTAAAKSPGQSAWLKEQGIPHRVDGKRVIVSREHVRAWLEGRTVQQSTGPNWGALKRA